MAGGRRTNKSITETLTSKEDLELQRKITTATEGFGTTKFCELILRDRTRISKDNALTVSNYIIAMQHEINPRPNTIRTVIQFLAELSKIVGIEKLQSHASENIKLTIPVSESRDHIQGPPTAPVTLLEYGDYECPYCAQAYIIIKEVQERLGGKLRFVFRNFPVTNVRPHAYETVLAAEAAAAAAAAQDKFWEMYDYLFKHGQWVTNDNLRQSAAKLGLDLAGFDRDFLDRRYSNHIDEDIQSAKSSGVKSTPSFFINEDRYDGAWDLDSLLGALDEESVFGWRQTKNSSI
jgi:protein-disulfide isomerase